MNALKTVLRSPGLIAGVWLVHIIVAGVFGFILHAAAIGASEPYAAATDGHDLFHLAELLDADKSLAVIGLGGAGAAVIAAALCWTVLSPFVIARLAGKGLGEIGEIGMRSLPAVIVQTLWHTVMRVAAFFMVLMMVAAAPGAVKLLLIVVAAGATALALDVVRVQVTLHDAARFSIRSAFFAFVRTFKNLRFLAAGVGIYALQVGTSVAILMLGLHSIGPGSTLWVVRVLALVTVVAGLWRLAFVVDLGAVSLEKAPEPEEDAAGSA